MGAERLSSTARLHVHATTLAQQMRSGCNCLSEHRLQAKAQSESGSGLKENLEAQRLRSHINVRRYLCFTNSCRQCYVPATKGPGRQRLQDAFCGGPTLPGVSRHVPVVHTTPKQSTVRISNWNSQVNAGDTVRESSLKESPHPSSPSCCSVHGIIDTTIVVSDAAASGIITPQHQHSHASDSNSM